MFASGLSAIYGQEACLEMLLNSSDAPGGRSQASGESLSGERHRKWHRRPLDTLSRVLVDLPFFGSGYSTCDAVLAYHQVHLERMLDVGLLCRSPNLHAAASVADLQDHLSASARLVRSVILALDHTAGNVGGRRVVL